MRIRLSDEDRARLGCPEWLDLDLDHYPIELAEAIEAAGGDWSKYRGAGAAAVRTRIWVGLHNADVEVPLPDFTFDIAGLTVEPGKAPSPDGDESTSTTSSSSVE